jgi:hypothetical protein
MMNDFDKARQFIVDAEERLSDIERREGRLQNFHLRLRSRAALMSSNMAILGRAANWADEVMQRIEPVHSADPNYYYATATLAQSCHARGNAIDAQRYFHEAYEAIANSGDLQAVKEVRSRILLLMVAGLCAKHGVQGDKLSDDYLDQADGLRSSLPQIGPQVCTVFSILSKRNENSDTIHFHIDLIRNGAVLVEINTTRR